MADIEMDYAVSIGEGTLLAYGKLDMTVGPPMDDEVIEQHKDTFTVILGPAIGTGE